MIKWFKTQSTSVKMMVILAIMLLIGIILRWEYISNQVSDSWRQRFETNE